MVLKAGEIAICLNGTFYIKMGTKEK